MTLPVSFLFLFSFCPLSIVSGASIPSQFSFLFFLLDYMHSCNIAHHEACQYTCRLLIFVHSLYIRSFPFGTVYINSQLAEPRTFLLNFSLFPILFIPLIPTEFNTALRTCRMSQNRNLLRACHFHDAQHCASLECSAYESGSCPS